MQKAAVFVSLFGLFLLVPFLSGQGCIPEEPQEQQALKEPQETPMEKAERLCVGVTAQTRQNFEEGMALLSNQVAAGEIARDQLQEYDEQMCRVRDAQGINKFDACMACTDAVREVLFESSSSP